MKLTNKQRRFIAEYLVDYNATQAAIRAGYAAKNADVTAARLLVKASIAAEIAAGQQQLLEQAEVSAARILQELSRIAISDIRQVFTPDGNLLQVSALPDAVAPAVASVEVVTRSIGEGEVEYVHKIKFWDKLKALELLAKRLGLVKELHEHSGKNGEPIKVVFGGRYRPAADGATAG
ncbi:MAG: terminase small subunit [Vicinamibacterales bacterium]